MKSLKIKKVLFTMLALVAVFMLFTVTAYAEEYGNFSYSSVEPEEGEEFEPYVEITGYGSDDDEEPVVVVIPDAIDDVPVTTISASAFSGVSNLKEVIIPDSVTTIHNAAFYNCHDLEIVIIPDSVTHIGDSAFQNCEKLKYVIIGDGVKSIGDIAFKDCDVLEAVSLGSAVESIGNGAFYNCTTLTGVRIPASVKEIENLAFGYYQNGNDDATVAGFTFYTDGANDAVLTYGAVASAEDSSEDVSAPAGSLSYAAFSVISNSTVCNEHSVKYTNIRKATESYDGLDIAVCADCTSIVTQPNYDIEAEESSSSLITFIVIGVLIVAFAVYAVLYVKKAKARRKVAVDAYNTGKPLPDAAEKEAQEKKEAEKYAKKKAKQEANLRKYIDF